MKKKISLKQQLENAKFNTFFTGLLATVIISFTILYTLKIKSELTFANKCGELNEYTNAQYNVNIIEACIVNGRSVYYEESLDLLLQLAKSKKFLGE